MKKKITDFSAYHGRSFKARKQTLTEEKNSIYSDYGTNSEYAPLNAVLLYCPGCELKNIKSPDAVQHLEKINPKKIALEHKAIVRAFKKEKVNVHFISASSFKNSPPPNLMFVRDLFWNGTSGAIVGRMGSLVRAGEEKYAAFSLAQLNVPTVLGVHHTGLFEGADLLWLDSQTLLCGIGNRTNREALKQLKQTLQSEKIKIVPIKLPKKVQHLLGMVQFIDKKKVLVRTEIAPVTLIRLLTKQKFKIVSIVESAEVTERQGMNIVTIRPSEIFMPKHCPELKDLYRKNGIKILAELEIGELLKGAGGLACATGILGRKML